MTRVFAVAWALGDGCGASWLDYVSFKSDFLRALRNSPLTIVAAAVVILLILAALFAPLIAPYTPFDPASLELFDGRTPPMQPNVYTGNRFWLGADDQGRDVFSTILYGMRISLLVGFSAVCLAAVIGVTLGLVSGYIGGWVDALIMRIADVQVTFPSILIALMIFGVARELTPVEQREEAAILITDPLYRAIRVGAICADGTRRYAGGKREAVRGRSAASWPQPAGHTLPPYFAQCAQFGAGYWHYSAGARDYRRSDPLLSRRWRAADKALAGDAHSHRPGLSV